MYPRTEDYIFLLTPPRTFLRETVLRATYRSRKHKTVTNTVLISLN